MDEWLKLLANLPASLVGAMQAGVTSTGALRAGQMGIAHQADGCYCLGMKTLTVKLPHGLLAWLENESKRANRPKSEVVREILQQHQLSRPRSALDMAADLCGCAQSGVRDLARNKKHLKGFGR